MHHLPRLALLFAGAWCDICIFNVRNKDVVILIRWKALLKALSNFWDLASLLRFVVNCIPFIQIFLQGMRKEKNEYVPQGSEVHFNTLMYAHAKPNIEIISFVRSWMKAFLVA